MADALPTTKYYQALGGVNQKASQYEMSVAQFLNLRNLDFDVPNALQKRPGSSLFSAQSLSGPVIGLFEFQKLFSITQAPSEFILANANGNVFYNTPLATTSFTLLSQNWGATQPVDFLTFANNAWMANGSKIEFWNGSSLFAAGLPLSSRITGLAPYTYDYLFGATLGGSGASWMLVNGATAFPRPSGFTSLARGLYLAYSYNRVDGYGGPADFLNTARNVVDCSVSSGTEFFAVHTKVGGFTVPAGRGITSVSIWLAEDTIWGADQTSFENIPNVGTRAAGALGWGDDINGTGDFLASYTLKPDADLSRFWLYTTIPTSSLFLTNNGSVTFFATTFIPGQSFGFYDKAPQPGFAFSAMPFDFFASYVPKYIAINQNRMFISGYSSAPSTTWWSEVGSPESYYPDSSFETRTNDGDRIYAIETYNNQLLVLKENSFHKLIGDNSDNFQLVQISDQYGCLSNKSVVQYDQKCLWLDKKGILEFNGANHGVLSGPIEGVFRRMNIAAAKEYAVGVHNRYRNQLWWGIPVDGSSVNNLTIVYDYLIGAWTFFDGFNPSSFSFMLGQLNRPTAWRGDYSGFVHFHGESFFNDSGRGISCVAFTRFEAAGENNSFIWRRFFLDVASASGSTGVINGRVFSSYDQTTVQSTFTMFQGAFQSRVEMGVVGKAAAVELSHFSASLPLLLNGYSWTKRGLRNV